MRTSFALVLALCGTFALAPSTAFAQTPAAPQPATAPAPAKPAINLNTATVEQLQTLPGI